MSLRVGLGASQADLDVQGEIDFDFFDESEGTNEQNKTNSESPGISTSTVSRGNYNKDRGEPLGNGLVNREPELTERDLNSSKVREPRSSLTLKKPMITVSCDDATGATKKTTIETVIPTPFNYKDNKCGKLNPSEHKKMKTLYSPRLKSKAFKEENEISDDSSISSMSGSESFSSESEDSFELEGSDSMTDVSPLHSPLHSPYSNSFVATSSADETLEAEAPNKVRKEGVKFSEEEHKKKCTKCEAIDLQELVSAMNQLKMKQNVNSMSVSSRKCGSSIITQNARCRKNLSFSNEEVRKIDSGNQLLLKKIMAQQNRNKTQSTAPAPVRASSAVNRQKHQRQIELENLALLKRLESTKASNSLSRSQLLRDYDHRSSGLLSRASSSRSSYPNSSSASFRSSAQASGRSSAISIKSNSIHHSSLPRSHSSSAADQF